MIPPATPLKRQPGRDPDNKPEKLSLNALLSVAAALITLVAAIIAISAGISAWTIGLLVGGVVVVAVIVTAPYLVRLSRRYFYSRARNRYGRALLAEAVEIGQRLMEQTEHRTDALPSAYFGLNQGEAFAGFHAPNPVRNGMLLQTVVSLMESPSSGKHFPLLFQLFDQAFAVFHDHHVMMPGMKAANIWDQLEVTDHNAIKRTWPRYQALVEDHRKLCVRAERQLDVRAGSWCNEMPNPPV